jgi:RNA binding exosome subunit
MKNKTEKRTIDELREIRDSISNDIKDLSYEQLMEYLEKKKSLHPKVKKQRAVNV